MLSPDLLDILRCPLDRQSRLTEDGAHLLCGRCGLMFPILDGFPKLIVEEAELPAGCPSLDQLPCQRERAAPGAAS